MSWTVLVHVAVSVLLIAFCAWCVWDIRRTIRRSRENAAAWDEATAAAEVAEGLAAEGRPAAARFAWRQYRGRIARAEDTFRQIHGEKADEMLAQAERAAREGRDA